MLLTRGTNNYTNHLRRESRSNDCRTGLPGCDVLFHEHYLTRKCGQATDRIVPSDNVSRRLLAEVMASSRASKPRGEDVAASIRR
jgi:hypothetical protein